MTYYRYEVARESAPDEVVEASKMEVEDGVLKFYDEEQSVQVMSDMNEEPFSMYRKWSTVRRIGELSPGENNG